MKKSRFSEEQIIGMLIPGEAAHQNGMMSPGYNGMMPPAYSEMKSPTLSR